MPWPLEIAENVPLSTMTTLGVGGCARWLATATSREDLTRLLTTATERNLPVMILGGGSNLLVSDRGWPGLVVRIATSGIEIDDGSSDVILRAAAGEAWDDVVAMAVSRGWSGIECLSGIPGLVGATPIQNVGAYGQDVAETIVEVEAIDRRTLESRRFGADECGFRYRDSRFKSDEPDRWIVVEVAFRLRDGGDPAIRYADLARHFETIGLASPGLTDVRDAVIGIRRAKGMVIDPNDPDSRSAGSFFTNPIVSADAADAIRRRGGDAAAMPAWPAENGGVKLSAAWLIEHAGFSKGFTRGAAALSSKHTLALVNRGGATANDLAALAATIRAKVREVWGVDLAPEPRYAGDFEDV